MSDKAKPLTPEERERCVQFAKALGDTDNLTEQHAVERLLRWDATLRQLEEGLATVTVERDAYRAFTDWWLHDETPAEALGASEYKYAFEGEGEYAAFRAALMNVYALPVSQPSGNSGELAAPATTKTIAETRMGEPNAVDAEEEET